MQTPTSSNNPPIYPRFRHKLTIIPNGRKKEVYNYAVSVPWRKVRQNEEVLLAWEMNGEPLPKIHGAPLRVVVAGYIGARSCKWVYRINALTEPSFGPVQRQEYLYYNQQVRTHKSLDSKMKQLIRGQIGKQNVLISNGFSIQAMPVSFVSRLWTPSPYILINLRYRSAIMEPRDRDVIIHDGAIALKGWAYSGNGNWVERVEVSPDG